jgi:probable HAF family extracellular repeat protein
MVRTWWHKLFSQGQSGVHRGDRRAGVRQRPTQKPWLESLEERWLLSYQITDLGVGGAHGINDSGQVVGGEGLWDPTNGWQDLGTLPGYDFSIAYGINNSGQVVGYSEDAVGNIEAFLWDATNGMQDLGHLPGFNYSWAYGINNSGQVVGGSGIIGTSFSHAFLWDASSGMQDLGTLGGNAGWAYGINSNGQVVGESRTASDAFHAFLWDATNGMQDLGILRGYSQSYADGINNSGQVVGGSSTVSSNHAFLWDASNGMQDLGTLGGSFGGADGINNFGQVVGYSYTASGQNHGFLWQDGTVSDLNDLIPAGSGWTLYVAWAIDNAGQIVGTGSLNGQTHAFLLTPDSSPLTAPAGTVHFTRSDAQAVLLAGSTVTAADAGAHPFSLTLGTLADQTLTVTDTAEATRIGRATVPLTSDAAAPAGRTVQNATDALFARSHRASASVSASDWEVTEFELGVSLLPKL